MNPDKFQAQREHLIVDELSIRGVTHEAVVAAMLRVPREEFIPEGLQTYSYANIPLSIGEGQTISQPLIVGLMTQLLNVKRGEKILEIGTGSGYQSAILAELGVELYTIERIEVLAQNAQRVLKKLGYNKIHFQIGDGYMGWPEKAPFDGIIATAAPKQAPTILLDQLKEGGRMVVPLGITGDQHLELITKRSGLVERSSHGQVSFVPMI